MKPGKHGEPLLLPGTDLNVEPSLLVEYVQSGRLTNGILDLLLLSSEEHLARAVRDPHRDLDSLGNVLDVKCPSLLNVLVWQSRVERPQPTLNRPLQRKAGGDHGEELLQSNPLL